MGYKINPQIKNSELHTQPLFTICLLVWPCVQCQVNSMSVLPSKDLCWNWWWDNPAIPQQLSRGISPVLSPNGSYLSQASLLVEGGIGQQDLRRNVYENYMERIAAVQFRFLCVESNHLINPLAVLCVIFHMAKSQGLKQWVTFRAQYWK